MEPSFLDGIALGFSDMLTTLRHVSKEMLDHQETTKSYIIGWGENGSTFQCQPDILLLELHYEICNCNCKRDGVYQ